MKVAFYHHGTVPNPKDVKALEGRKYVGRNASAFVLGEVEPFDVVLIDKGANTDAIKAAYGDKVQSMAEFLKSDEAAPAAEPAFDPDGKPQKPDGKTQGR